jgi:acyl-CoA thioester hydrolase
MTSPPQVAFRMSYTLRVRWAEVDPQGIVFNAHYLTYADVAITEYWREVGCLYPNAFTEHGVDTFVVKATLEYHRPARFDDEIEVLVRVARIGRSSLRVLLEVHRNDEHLVSGELIYVVASTETRAPTPVPAFLRDAILRYETTPPEQQPPA